MPKRILLISIMLLIQACTPAAAPTAETRVITVTTVATETPFITLTPSDRSVYGRIKLVGTPEFISQTRAALALLEEKDPPALMKIQTYIGIIGQGEHSGMWAWETPPRYEVGDATAFYSVTWYASTIAHDATHSELYHQFEAAHPGEPVPENAYGGIAIERFCNGYQLEVLKRIGAPQSEIDYMSTLDGTHCDVDGDGDCDWDDYQNRNW